MKHKSFIVEFYNIQWSGFIRWPFWGGGGGGGFRPLTAAVTLGNITQSDVRKFYLENFLRAFSFYSRVVAAAHKTSPGNHFTAQAGVSHAAHCFGCVLLSPS